MKGKLITLEGRDGIGKSTQLEKLHQRLEDNNYQVLKLSFPDYDHGRSYYAKRYLNGGLGSIESINPQAAAIIFAMERFDIKHQIEQALKDNQVVICSRYTLSNLVYQGAHFPEALRQQFYDWVLNIETQVMQVIEPDLTIILDLNDRGVKQLLEQRQNKQDLLDTQTVYQNLVGEIYRQFAEQNPQKYCLIDCTNSMTLNTQTPIEVHEQIWQVLLDKF